MVKEQFLLRGDRSSITILLALALMIVAIDGHHVWHSRHSAISFTGMSWDIAESLRKGEGYSFIAPSYFPFSSSSNKVSAAREPVPVVLFAGIGLLAGGSYVALGAFHIGIRIITLFGIVALARRLEDNRLAMISALFWVVYLPAIREVPAKEVDLNAAACAVWSLAFFARAWSDGGTGWWAASGLMLGLAVLSRSAFMAVALGLAGLAVIAWKKPALNNQRAAVNARAVGLFLLVFSAVQLPWIARNYRAFGRPVIGTTLFGYNLYRQNHFLEEGKFVPFVAGPETERALLAFVSKHPELTGRENEAEFDRLLQKESARIILSHPGEYVLLSFYRALPLWFNWKVPEAYGQAASISDYFLMLEHGLFLTFAFLVGARALASRAWPIVVAVGTFTLIHMAVAARMLYAIDVIPLLLPLSMKGIVDFKHRHHWAWVILPTCIIICFLYAVVAVSGRLPLPSS